MWSQQIQVSHGHPHVVHHFSLAKVWWWWWAVLSPNSHSCQKGDLKPTESCGLVCFLRLLSFHRCCKTFLRCKLNVWSFQQCQGCTHSCGKYKASRSRSFLFLKTIVNVAASTLSSLGGDFLPCGRLFLQQVWKWWCYQPYSILVSDDGLPFYQLMNCCPSSFLGICSLSCEGSESSLQFFLSWERRSCSN